MLAGACELVGRSLVAFCLVGTWGFDAICFANPMAWVAADLMLVTTWIVKSRLLKRDARSQLGQEPV